MLFLVSAPNEWGWFSVLCRLPGVGDWCLCSGGWVSILSVWWAGPHPVMCFGVVCQFSMIIGSLSANRWGCVPILLVVWHGASNCWPFGEACLNAEMEISGRALASWYYVGREVSGGQVSWTWLSHLRGSGLTPGQSTKTLLATQLRRKGRRKERKINKR